MHRNIVLCTRCESRFVNVQDSIGHACLPTADLIILQANATARAGETVPCEVPNCDSEYPANEFATSTDETDPRLFAVCPLHTLFEISQAFFLFLVPAGWPNRLANGTRVVVESSNLPSFEGVIVDAVCVNGNPISYTIRDAIGSRPYYEVYARLVRPSA